MSGTTINRDQRLANRKSHEPVLLSEVAADDPRRPELERGWFFCRHCGVRGEDTYERQCPRVMVVTPAQSVAKPFVQPTRPGLLVEWTAEDEKAAAAEAFDPFAPVEVEKPAATAHARLGPSDADRWWNCPGAINASKGLARSTSSYAEAGTAAHWVGETCLAMGGDAADFIGQKAPNGVEIDRDTAAAVQVYLDEVRRQQGETFADISVEGRADLTHIDPDLFGTYDSRLVVPFDVAHVNDYKNGAKMVEATALQLKIYALDALKYDVERVITTVVQPNAQHDDGPVRSHTYTRAELEAFVPEVAKHAAATRDPNAPLKAGPWCHYCPKASTCATLQARSLEIAQAEFANAELGVPLKAPPKPADMTPAQLAEVLRLWPIVEAWGNAVHTHARNLAHTGVEVPGFKLVAGKLGNRAWRDELMAADALQKVGVDPYETKVISPAAAEKLMGKKAFAAQASTLTHRAPGAVALVPETDKRPAIACGPASDFDAVTPETSQE
jgi:hypothetical protein